MDHIYYRYCNNPDCGGTCIYCTLDICKVCGLGEGSLTSECPGINSLEMADEIYDGLKDFKNGKWINL